MAIGQLANPITTTIGDMHTSHNKLATSQIFSYRNSYNKNIELLTTHMDLNKLIIACA